MKKQYCTWNGVTATIWHLDKGEEVAEHQHPNEHTTMAIAGCVRVFIGDGSVYMKPTTEVITLPAGTNHRIVAMLDGTIVMNMGAAGNAPTAQPNTKHAGVMLHDGTVVE